MKCGKRWHTGVLLAVVAATLILAACGSISDALSDPDMGDAEELMDDLNRDAELEVGAADNGRTLELAAGEVLVVSLDSNPTTGYGWEVSEIDEGILSQEGEPVYVQGGAEGMVGAGGVETYRFMASGSGKATLTLIYHRAWEEGVEPLETFSVDIVVD
jgi:predicted secreted protein